MSTRNYRELSLHILYWVFFVAFLTIVWGSTDLEYGRNFMIQILTLPSRLALVYGTYFILIPRFVEKERYMNFFIGLTVLLITSTVLVQRTIMIYVVQGRYLGYHSESFFRIVDLTNTAIDVGIGAVIPFGYFVYQGWHRSTRTLKELSHKKELNGSDSPEYIVVKEGTVKHKVVISDIVYIESLKNYLKFQTQSKEIVSYGSISKIEEQLPAQFLRVQRSFIINFDYLEEFTAKNLTIDGTKISIGRKYKEDVLNRIQGLKMMN